MHKTLISLVTLGSLLLLGACTTSNNCTGNGYDNPEYCLETLHPNAGPYEFKNSEGITAPTTTIGSTRQRAAPSEARRAKEG